MSVIDSHQVALSKVTVDIQVIRVGTRQMTLAIYRQLPTEAPVYHDRPFQFPDAVLLDLKYRGIRLWGTVNRHKDLCDEFYPGPHKHMLWDDGDELFVWPAFCLNADSRYMDKYGCDDVMWKIIKTLPRIFIGG